MKKYSNILKYDCNVCNYTTNDKKEFSDHIGWAVHKVAAMKKLNKMDEILDTWGTTFPH